MDNTIVKP